MIISKETLSLVEAFKSPILKALKGIKDEFIYSFNDGLSDYIEVQRDKFLNVKTFLFRNEKVNFYDTYFPVTLSMGKKNLNYSKGPLELFNNSQCITVIGHAGSGKSMLLKHLFLSSIETTRIIPIVIELRNFNEFEGSVIEYFYSKIFINKLSPNENILERILGEGKFLFLLDGFDEIYSSNKQKIVHELDSFIDKFPNNYYLITSRPGANIESLPRFNNVFVEPLSNKQIIDFINMQFKFRGDESLAKKVIETIRKPENGDYSSYLSSPLLLSMFILTYTSYPELPKSKNKFYWNVFDTLCTKHDSFARGVQHERKTKLLNEEIENILKWFAYISLFEGKYAFDSQYLNSKLLIIKERLRLDFDIACLVEDLTVAVSIIIIDGLEYKFPHKSLQEYFAALLIKEQSIESKKKIYTEKLPTLLLNSYGGQENFWNLCVELDKASFYEFFIIRVMKEFISKVDNNDEKIVFKNILKFFQFGEGVNFSKEKAISLAYTSGYRTAVSEIIPFIGIGDYEGPCLFNYNTKFAKEYYTDLKAKGFLEIDKSHPNDPGHQVYRVYFYKLDINEFYNLSQKIGFTKNIVGVTEEVKPKITELEHELEGEENTKVSLLDI